MLTLTFLRSATPHFALAVALAGCGGMSSGTLASGNTEKSSAQMLPSVLNHMSTLRRMASQEHVLYNFRGLPDAENPQAGGLLADASGSLYGTTLNGGTGSGCYLTSCGTVFKLTPSGGGYKETVLYSFQGGNDGGNPSSSLISDKTGALYGTTLNGGGSKACQIGCGSVFKLTPSGSTYTESILHVFTGGSDGANPMAGLVASKTGALYGTTYGGGSSGCSGGCGTVFKLRPSKSGYVESVVYSFQSMPDGVRPEGNLLFDKAGNLYGTTYLGGKIGPGTVFKLTRSGTKYSESVLYSFKGGSDGSYPMGSLVLDEKGVLYGATLAGGTDNGCTNHGCGTVFKLKPAGPGYAESVAYRFLGNSDAAGPEGGLVIDSTGALFGATRVGGTAYCGGNGCGTVFKLARSGSGYTESLLYVFQGGSDGADPNGGLIADQSGALYGTTSSGGSTGNGNVFKVTP